MGSEKWSVFPVENGWSASDEGVNPEVVSHHPWFICWTTVPTANNFLVTFWRRILEPGNGYNKESSGN